MVSERTLSELVAGQEGWSLAGDPAARVRSISSDSRRVEPGALFVAIRGEKDDGHAHIADAIAKGAAAVALERFPPSAHLTGGGPLAVLQVPDSRAALAELSAAFYGRPSEKLALYGVTGTNGKTTVTFLLESLFERAGEKTGVIGTINYRYAGRSFGAPNTTPESVDLQRMLAEMAEAGVRRAVMEVSSHALVLHRVLACDFRGAVFTNLSQDHLDFHKDMDAYYEAKERLFRHILPRSRREPFAVVNADDPRAERLVRAIPEGVRVLRFSLSRPAEVRAVESEATLSGVRARVESPVGELRLESPLGGLYNLSNLLAAAAVGAAEGMTPSAIEKGLAAVQRVPGRFERVGRSVIVDYAHTPDALENLLSAARPLCGGRIVTVFGCGGDRDRAKRPLMGEAAGRLSDVAVVTSDNPRSEEPLAIIEEILPGVRRSGLAELAHLDAPRGYVVIPDRREAIREAVRMAREEDLVVVAGKGHEDYQIVGTKRIRFDDREEAAQALRDLGRT